MLQISLTRIVARRADVQADTPINQAIEAAARSGFLAENDPYCPSRGTAQPSVQMNRPAALSLRW